MELKSGPANLLSGPSSVSGTLVLGDGHLMFESHSLNVHRPSVIEVADIDRLDLVRAKILGVIPGLPNRMDIVMHSGQTFSFRVERRGDWIAAIGRAQAEVAAG